jgi:hypothetical protein
MDRACILNQVRAVNPLPVLSQLPFCFSNQAPLHQPQVSAGFGQQPLQLQQQQRYKNLRHTDGYFLNSCA